MTEETEPPPWLILEWLFPVQTSSPNLSLYKSWAKERVAFVYTMNPWDWDELVAGLSLQESVNVNSIDYSRLQESYHKYGPVPRNVYSAYRGILGMRFYDHLTLDVIKDASRSFDHLEDIVLGSGRYNRYTESSNKLICLRREGDDGDACAAVLSPFVAGELLKARAFANLQEKRQVVRLFTTVPEMGIARGWIFEAYGHEYLSTAQDNPEGITTYTLIPVATDPQQYMPDLGSKRTGAPFPLLTRKIHLYGSTDDIRDRDTSEPEYHIPLARNNPGFDSFLITDNAVYIFQMTASHEHAADTRSPRGLGLLQRMLPDIPWHYVMVVPHANVKSVRLTSVHQKWVEAVASFLLIVLDVSDVIDQ